MHLQQAKSLFQKVGVAHKTSVAATAVIVLPYHAFIILQLMWSNPGQTRIIFKPGLTRMTWTKRDPVDPDDPGDPTRFQCWYAHTGHNSGVLCRCLWAWKLKKSHQLHWFKNCKFIVPTIGSIHYVLQNRKQFWKKRSNKMVIHSIVYCINTSKTGWFVYIELTISKSIIFITN